MKPLVVFAYNFPHKKTQDILLYLFVLGYNVKWVLAANPVKLNIPPPSIRSKIRHAALLPPQKIAQAIGARYYVVDHNSEQAKALLDEIKPELGIIAGARILKKHIIDTFTIGIINLHPGLIPEVRGLDALLWAIYKGVPLGVTAHLIDERIDAGRILVRREIPVYHDDTLLDLSERLYEAQLELLPVAIERALKGEWTELSNVGSYNRKMPAELERKIPEILDEYKKRFAR